MKNSETIYRKIGGYTSGMTALVVAAILILALCGSYVTHFVCLFTLIFKIYFKDAHKRPHRDGSCFNFSVGLITTFVVLGLVAHMHHVSVVAPSDVLIWKDKNDICTWNAVETTEELFNPKGPCQYSNFYPSSRKNRVDLNVNNTKRHGIMRVDARHGVSVPTSCQNMKVDCFPFQMSLRDSQNEKNIHENIRTPLAAIDAVHFFNTKRAFVVLGVHRSMDLKFNHINRIDDMILYNSHELTLDKNGYVSNLWTLRELDEWKIDFLLAIPEATDKKSSVALWLKKTCPNHAKCASRTSLTSFFLGISRLSLQPLSLFNDLCQEGGLFEIHTCFMCAPEMAHGCDPYVPIIFLSYTLNVTLLTCILKSICRDSESHSLLFSTAIVVVLLLSLNLLSLVLYLIRRNKTWKIFAVIMLNFVQFVLILISFFRMSLDDNHAYLFQDPGAHFCMYIFFPFLSLDGNVKITNMVLVFLMTGALLRQVISGFLQELR